MNNSELIARNIIENTNLSDDLQLDYMFDMMHNLMNRNRFDIIDKILELIDVEKITSHHALFGILTSTFPAKTRLKNRKKILERIRLIFYQTRDKEEVDRMLKNHD